MKTMRRIPIATTTLAIQAAIFFVINSSIGNNNIGIVSASTTVASSKATIPPSSLDNDDEEALKKQKHEFEQWYLLQARSSILRNELQKRGVKFPSATNTGMTTKRKVDWDCALSTASNPKRCLYSLDAQENSKVVAPIDTDDYISLSSLIRLRREDPSKVEPMWHDKYDIFNTWFASLSASSSKTKKDDGVVDDINNKYSLYHYLNWKGALLSMLLDNDWILTTSLAAAAVMAILVTKPVWEFLIKRLLTSGWFWTHWKHWGRFVHAALPLKLLLAQMTYKGVAKCLIQAKAVVKEALVSYECTLWEESIPLTILEKEEVSSKKKKRRKKKH